MSAHKRSTEVGYLATEIRLDDKSYNLLTVHLLRLAADLPLDRQLGKRCFLVTSGSFS